MQTTFSTLADLGRFANSMLVEAKTVGRIIHEINGKVMASPASRDLKLRWADVYERWTSFELNHPAMTSPDPRLGREDLTLTSRLVATMKQQALELYARWKAEMQAAGIQTSPTQSSSGAANSAPIGPTTTPGGLAQQEKPGGNDKLLKGLLIGAALVGGAAATQQLISGWRNRNGVPVIPAGIPGSSPYFPPGFAPSGFPIPTVPALAQSSRPGPFRFSLPPMPGQYDNADDYEDED